MPDIVRVQPGGSPIILAFPHSGTTIPSDIWDCLNDNGRVLADADWHLPELYNGLLADVTTIMAQHHRYVIDVNRDPTGISLYPGQNTTGLVPAHDFDGCPIWRAGAAPDEAEVARRLALFHVPYHAALAAEIDRVKAIHGLAVVYDCHSIRSRIPFLFENTLPDLNIGTNMGITCAPEIEAAAIAGAAAARGFTNIVNGRFRGGWTTRNYGQPTQGVHAIQMELAQITHLLTESPPFTYHATKAELLRTSLRDILARIQGAAQTLASKGTS